MNKQVNRRNFLKISAAAGAALGMAPVGIYAKEKQTDSGLPQRTLGSRTGIKLPVLSLGCSQIDNPNILRAAHNSGISFFDTANGYLNGRSEETLGEFFADKPRDSFVIGTKIRQAPADNAAAQFAENFEGSMRRLKLSYVDIFYYWDMRTAEDVNYAPVMEVMQRLKREGRIKNIGLATHSNEAVVINAAVDNGNYDVILVSYNYNRQDDAALNSAIARAAEAGLGMIAMKVMAGGFLDRERTQRVNTRAALKWVLQNNNIHTTVPGLTTFEMMEESLDAVKNLTLTPEERNFLSAANNSDTMYCKGCGYCNEQCIKGLPVAPMMRAYMYNYGYKSPALAKEVIDELGLADIDPCKDCSVCQINCASGFRISQKIKDIARLRDVPQEFLV